MKGYLRLTRRLLSILCVLVVLNAGAFSACADDKKLPEEDEGVIAVDDLFNREDQEEELTIVVSDAEQEEKKEKEKPDESVGSIGSENEDSPKISSPAVESELSEGENQQEKTNDLLAEDDEVKTDQEEENDQQEEKGQENDQTDGQEETAAAETKEKPEEFVPTEVMLSPLKRGDLTEDKQKKTEEPQTEEPLLRNTKGSVGYTVAVLIEDNPTVKSGPYCIFAYVDKTEYKQTITGSAETALSIPERPEKIFIADSDGRTIDELQALNREYYLVSEPEFDEENWKYTFNLKKRIECRMQFQSLSDDLQLSGKYHIVAKRKRSGTPVACASIDNGKTDGFGQNNIYNDSTFVIYKIDEFIFDYYKSNPGYYSQYIVEPGQATENGVVFSWSSEPKLVNKSYVYYIYGGKKKEIETEELTEYSNVTVTSKDQYEVTLNEAEFKLYAESACTTEIKTCAGGCFTISTDDTALGNYLPTETGTSNARTLYLKETKVPAGYEIDKDPHPVVITKVITEQLDEAASKKTITTSYGITIDGESAVDITNTRLTKEERIDGSITVTAKDQDGASLNGLAFGLYLPQECGEDTEIATYSEQSFTISTGLDTLASHLPVEPGADHATTLYLKQTVGLVGFNMDTTVHPVVITKAICTELIQESNVYTFVTTITYEIMIDNKNAIDITNSRHTKEERIDGSITVTAKDQARKALSGLTFGLYSSKECGEDTEIATYSEQSFTISTGSEALKSYLPTEIGPENATTLYLKQTAAPVGYDADTEVHSVVITKAVSTDLVEVSNVYMYVTTTTYGIVIDDKNVIDITNTKRTKDERAYGEASVTAKDQDGAALDGLVFGLYPAQECVENTKIATFSKQSFAISTGLDALASHLPTGTGLENATTLYLKQTTAPAGYDADTAVHSVVITKTVKTDLVEESNTYVTTTAYGITIDGKSAVDITNRKRTGTDRKDGTITIIIKDNNGNELNGSSFGLYSDGSCSTAAIDIYTGGRFEIGTNETALTNYLPTETGEDHATTLYLKQKTVPAGYDADIKVHSIAITKAVSTDLVEVSSVYMYVTKTTYGIVIDDKNAIDITNTKRTKDERAYGEVSVTAKDQDGAALNGLAFGLYPAQECAEKTEIATFSGQSFAISTELDALTSHLPTETGLENATTLYLKQTTSPTGYDADTAVHSVVITKTVKTDLDEESNTYVTTTAYGIMIDGESAVDIINRKRTGTDRKDGSITIINKDNSGNELSGSSFGLYSDASGSTAAIDNYTGGRFTISTNDTALTNCLPTETGTAHARTLYLKETEAPAGYDKETAVHTLVITKSIDTYFDNTENKYITRTTYGIAVDGGSTIDIKNTKRTDEKRTYGSVVVTAKDQDGVALDGLTFGLYPAQECAENTQIATFSKQSFAISTGLDALANHLPTGTGSENATTLYLKQTAATPGYDADTVVYPVMITRSETVTLDRDVNAFITMITYVITVDGGDEKVIINRKQNNTNNEENTTNAGTEGNPNSDGNGADASSEGDGNKTNDGENEDQTTGENGKPTTDEENGNSAASAGTQDNTTGGKDGNDSGIKTNQTRKESEKTQTNTGTASISSGETAKTNPAVQTVETDKRNKTDKSPSLTGTEVWRRKTNPGKTKAAAGKRENVIADSVENGWLVSVLQEAIRILAKAVDLLSTIIRTSFPAFLK